MASTYRLNSSSNDYITANYFDSKDSTIYVHRYKEKSGGGSGEPASAEHHWEYVAAIGESQQFKELELSGVVIHGQKLVELVGDLRPKSTATSSSFYSLRVNCEGRCYIRSSSAGDCLQGAKLDAFFDWSKYGVLIAKKDMAAVEEKWKEVAEERKRELEACKLKLSKFIIEEDGTNKQGKEHTGKKKLEEEGEFICTSAAKEEGGGGGRGKNGGHMNLMMDYFAISVVVFYVVGLYYWGAKLVTLLLPKKPT